MSYWQTSPISRLLASSRAQDRTSTTMLRRLAASCQRSGSWRCQKTDLLGGGRTTYAPVASLTDGLAVLSLIAGHGSALQDSGLNWQFESVSSTSRLHALRAAWRLILGQGSGVPQSRRPSQISPRSQGNLLRSGGQQAVVSQAGWSCSWLWLRAG